MSEFQDDRHNRTMDAARVRIQNEIDAKTLRIAELESQIQQREEETRHLEQENEGNKQEEMMDQVALRNEGSERNPRNIAPEDALDTIIRLENAVKLASRRNTLYEKELAVRQRNLKEQTKDLDKFRKEHNELISVTGFSSETKTEDVDTLRGHVEEMERLETTLQEEAKTAKVIIRKKQQLVETLQKELEDKKKAEEDLFALYNDIRVKDRDVHQAEAELEDFKRQDRKRNSALALADERRDVVALSCLEKDKDYLKKEVARSREVLRRQDVVQKKQVQRQLQLQARIDMISAALKDLGWDKELEQSIANGALIADPIGEPDDDDRIMPPNEVVPAEVFELLRINFETVSNNLSRKDILLLEKTAVVQAMEEKVQKATAKHASEVKQQLVSERDRDSEMQLRQEELTAKLADYRAQIDTLTRQNLKLRSQIEKAAQGV